MSNFSIDRTVIGGLWVLKQEYDIDHLISKQELISDYMIALLEVAAADGILSDPERQWVIGLACAMGMLIEQVFFEIVTCPTNICFYFQERRKTSSMSCNRINIKAWKVS